MLFLCFRSDVLIIKKVIFWFRCQLAQLVLSTYAGHVANLRRLELKPKQVYSKSMCVCSISCAGFTLKKGQKNKPWRACYCF